MRKMMVWLGAVTLVATGMVYAADPPKKLDLKPAPDTRSEAQKTTDANLKTAQEVAKRQEAEKMRDTTHDGRLKVGKDTSVGGKVNPPEVNLKTTTK